MSPKQKRRQPPLVRLALQQQQELEPLQTATGIKEKTRKKVAVKKRGRRNNKHIIFQHRIFLPKFLIFLYILIFTAIDY
jgi:hypothetical protein